MGQSILGMSNVWLCLDLSLLAKDRSSNVIQGEGKLGGTKPIAL